MSLPFIESTLTNHINFFVIMPIGDAAKNPVHHQHFKEVYDKIIRPSIETTCKVLNVTPDLKRADDISKSGDVMKQVIARLTDDSIVIADLSTQNPNVFYELGIRHTLMKRTILLFNGEGKIPFDISPYRVIHYQFPFAAEHERAVFNRCMSEVIKDIILNPTSPDNPVWDCFGSGIISGPKPNGEVIIDFKCDESASNGNSHIYFLNLGVTNNGDKAFNSVDAELSFPPDYLHQPTTNYDFLTFEDERIGGLRYKKINFTFKAIPERARNMKSSQLRPGNTFWIFHSDGKKAMYVLSYCVNNANVDNIHKYKVYWKIFLNGNKPIEGSREFKELQEF